MPFNAYTPKEEIAQIRDSLFEPVLQNITLLETWLTQEINKIEHSAAQALLYKQKYFLENL